MLSLRAVLVVRHATQARVQVYKGGLRMALVERERARVHAAVLIGHGAEPNVLPVGVQRVMAYAGEL
jgi:hypothetical protein